MAVPYANCFRLPKVSTKCRLFTASTGRFREVSVCPIYACIRTWDQAFRVEAKVDSLLDSVKWDDKGLAVAIAQNVDTGAILMQGFVNKQAFMESISSRKATFYSR